MRKLILLAIAVAVCTHAATLEQLTIEQMAQKSMQIVRGRVLSCGGELRGSVIYTRCRASVSERWKGGAGSEVEFLILGGVFGGFTQTFTGTPKLASGQEYIFFLWAGRSGTNQIIGLSQGVFDLQNSVKTGIQAVREASTEVMLAPNGVRIEDTAVRMSIVELRNQVARALGEVK